MPVDYTAIVAILSVFIGAPLAIGVSRFLWKRAAGEPKSGVPDDLRLRMQRMQESIDAMAVEIERISEGQRFVTRLMAEKAPASLKPGADAPARDAR